ncbi:dermatopontin-like [Lampetra fluviatilis]
MGTTRSTSPPRSPPSRARPAMPTSLLAMVVMLVAVVVAFGPQPALGYPYDEDYDAYDDRDGNHGGGGGGGSYNPYDPYGGGGGGHQSHWTNVYRQRFYFQCPPGQVLSELRSEHSAHRDHVDRLWGFQCRVESPAMVMGECFWEEYNRAGLPWYQLCSDGAVVAGVQSNYFEAVLDREWQFYCCRFLKQCPYGSWMTQDVPDYPGQELRFSLLPEFYIRGAATTFSPVERDRQWKFVVARLGDCPEY